MEAGRGESSLKYTEVPEHLLKWAIDVMQRSTDLDESHKNSILNVYLFGSRAIALDKPDSDYDLIALVDGEYYVGPKLIEEGDININIYHVIYFTLLLKENLPWVIMVLFLPHTHVLQKKVELDWHIRKASLRKTSLVDAKHNLQKAKRSWKEGNIYKSKKNLVHGLRYLSYCQQLLLTGKIHTLTAVNNIWQEVMEDKTDNWDYYENKYKPVYDAFIAEINKLAEPQLGVEPKLRKGLWPKKEKGKDAEGPKKLKIVEFIEKYGLDELQKEFAIAVTRHSKFPHLVHLGADKVDSPQDEPIVMEAAYGIVLNEAENWKVVSFPYEKFFGHYRAEALPLLNEIDWPDARVYEKIEGSMAVLYYYGGEWWVSSWETPDGSEVLFNIVTKEGLYYYHSRKPCYNPWQFFEAKLEWNYRADAFASHSEERKDGYYPNQVGSVMATSDPSAEPAYTQYKTTFAEIFWDIWKKKGYKLPDDENGRKFCYMFVMRSDKQQLILARGPKEDEVECIALHGMRNIETSEEYAEWHEYGSKMGWECVRQIFYDGVPNVEHGPSGFPSVKEIQALSHSLDPTELAGYVAVGRVKPGGKFPNKLYRIKVKSPQHRALERLCWKSNDEDRTRNLFIDLIRSNDSTTFLNRFPQWKGLYNDVKQEFEDLRDHINSIYTGAVKTVADGEGSQDQLVKILEKQKMLKGILLKMMNLGLHDCKPILMTWPWPLLQKVINDFSRNVRNKVK